MDELTEKVISAAMQVHRELGPGLLESTYEIFLCQELSERGLQFDRQSTLPVTYHGTTVDCGYRIDLIVESTVIVELKSVTAFNRIHLAQMLTYLKLSGHRIGLLINFSLF